MKSNDWVADAVEAAARWLPAQGPINVFVHHNPLHTLEQLPFEAAVVQASQRLGCRAFLAEARYREAIASGRITESDLSEELQAELGERSDEMLVGELSRRELWWLLLRYGYQDTEGPALRWLLNETDVLEVFRKDVPRAPPSEERASEATRVRELWTACGQAVQRSENRPLPEVVRGGRHRDLLIALGGIDVDDWVHALLIPFVGAYLDQGLAQWPMNGRERGMHACFVQMYSRSVARCCGPWARELPRVVGEDLTAERDAKRSLEHSLRALGVPEGEWEEFLTAEALGAQGLGRHGAPAREAARSGPRTPSACKTHRLPGNALIAGPRGRCPRRSVPSA